jgi:hypothetical protein
MSPAVTVSPHHLTLTAVHAKMLLQPYVILQACECQLHLTDCCGGMCCGLILSCRAALSHLTQTAMDLNRIGFAFLDAVMLHYPASLLMPSNRLLWVHVLLLWPDVVLQAYPFSHSCPTYAP